LLEQHIKDDGIKCVVNLRGDHETADWHKSELDVCTRLSVDHVDIGFDLRKLPDPERAKQLVERFENGPYPLLMHCRAGSERTGMAAALYCMVVEHKTLDEALRTQTGWPVGHFRNASNDAGDRFFELYATTANGQNIKEWILQKYPDIYKQVGQFGGVADLKR
jgi:protein tyrosine/serine phosphatase